MSDKQEHLDTTLLKARYDKTQKFKRSNPRKSLIWFLVLIFVLVFLFTLVEKFLQRGFPD